MAIQFPTIKKVTGMLFALKLLITKKVDKKYKVIKSFNALKNSQLCLTYVLQGGPKTTSVAMSIPRTSIWIFNIVLQ